MVEKWKYIKGWEGSYKISSLGRVKSPKGNIKKLQTNNCGYRYVILLKDNIQKILLVHRLVAQAFIPNPEDKPQVNHKNGNKTDNRVVNLEWMTAEENILHSINVLKKECASRKVLCIETNEVFDSITAAAKSKKTYQSSISDVINGKKRKTSGGYHWKAI